MQKVVHQRVDRDQAAADLDPARAAFGGGEQNAGQRHGQHLVGNAVNLPQRIEQRLAHPIEPVGSVRIIGFAQPVIDPADQIAVRNIADEQVERIGGLVEAAVAQIVARQWASVDVARLAHRCG